MAHALVKNKTPFILSVVLHPLDRIGEPDGVAGAIRWFLSPEEFSVIGHMWPEFPETVRDFTPVIVIEMHR